MNVSDHAAFDALLRTDFEFFLQRCFATLNPGQTFRPNWQISALAHALDGIRNGDVTRQIINLPPRYLKSLTVSVAFPAFVLGHEPHRRIYAISYSNELATKHARDFRSIVESDWYRRAFPKMRIERCLDDDVTTRSKGFRRATSIGGSLTGLGGDMFIIDDPQKAADATSAVKREGVNQWVSNTLMSRLDNKVQGVIIVVMQRVHLNDLCGYLMQGSEAWDGLSLPVIATDAAAIPTGADRFYHRVPGEALHPAHEFDRHAETARKDPGPGQFRGTVSAATGAPIRLAYQAAMAAVLR